MDTSNLSKALTCDEALEWLQKTLEDPENEDLYPDEVMRATLEIDWKSEEEFLEFFKEISIQLARTASKNTSEETVSLFGIPLCSALSLWSPYYMIWEKAFSTKSLRLNEKINIREWTSEIPPETESLILVNLIPLAAAYEHPIFEALRNRTISDLTYFEEEFMGYLASSLSPGYYEGILPVEIIYIPSTRILSEIFDDWMMYQDLWTPQIIQEVMELDYADQSIKEKIALVLRGESNLVDPEAWEGHVEKYWSGDDIKRTLELCE